MARLKERLARGWNRFKKFVSGAWRGGKKIAQVVVDKSPEILKKTTDIADKLGGSNNDKLRKMSEIVKKGTSGAQNFIDKGQQFYDKHKVTLNFDF